MQLQPLTGYSMMGGLEFPTFGFPQAVSLRNLSVERRVRRLRQGTIQPTSANKATEDANDLLIRGGFLRQVSQVELSLFNSSS
jgi:hypothetical protein